MLQARAWPQRNLPPSASLKPKPAKVNPLATPLRVAYPQIAAARPAAPVGVPAPDVVVVDPNAPLPFELENILFRVSVRFASRDINPPLPSLLLLSAANRPQLGFFTVVIFNRKFCQWPMSAWLDYTTGADNLIGVSFQDVNNAFQGYELYFHTNGEMMEFMSTVRSIQAGHHVVESAPTSASPSTPRPAPATAPSTVRPPPGFEARAVNSPVSVSAPASTPRPAPSTARSTVKPPPGFEARAVNSPASVSAPRPGPLQPPPGFPSVRPPPGFSSVRPPPGFETSAVGSTASLSTPRPVPSTVKPPPGFEAHVVGSPAHLATPSQAPASLSMRTPPGFSSVRPPPGFETPVVGSPAPLSTPRPAPTTASPQAPSSLSVRPPPGFEAPVVASPVVVVHAQVSSPGIQRAANNQVPVVQQQASSVIGSAAPAAVAQDTRHSTKEINGSNQEDAHVPTESSNSSSQADTPPSPLGELEQDTLIAFDEDDISVVSQPRSEATELLSTLDPFEYADDATLVPSGRVSSSEIIDTARHLFSFFFLSGAGGRTETIAELNQMAEGVRSGVLEHIMRDARARGRGAQEMQEIRNTVDSIFATLTEANRRAVQARTKPRRIQYTPEELLSMRHGAVQPPDSLAQNPYLPKRGARSRQASTSSRGGFRPRPSPWDNGGRSPAVDQSHVSKSASAMQWVLGEETQTQPEVPETKPAQVAHPEPEKAPSESGTARTATSSVTSPDIAQDTGLQSSRWASDMTERKHANYFTGPAYEKTWSKRSYLEDLVQLDPQAKVTAGAEDIVDFYFPMSNNNEAPAGPAEPQSSANDNRVLSPTGAESAAAAPQMTDNIDILSAGFSRLSIQSPTTAPLRESRFAARDQLPSSVAQASRELQGERSYSVARVEQSIATSALERDVSARRIQRHSPRVDEPRVDEPRLASLLFASTTRSTASPEAATGPSSVESTPATQSPSPSVVSAQSDAPPAPEPRLRGLAASRHSSGAGLASSGKFHHHLGSK